MGRPKIPATARGEATRRKLLRAAEAEFGELGYHEGSISGITTRADIGQGTYYLYFDSKLEIFKMLLEETERAIFDSARQLRAQARDRLDLEHRRLKWYCDFALQHPHLYRVVQEAQFVLPEAHKGFYSRLAKAYAIGLNEAANQGQISAGDGEVRAWALLGISHFLGMRHALWLKQPPDAAELEALASLISRGMATK